MTYDAAVTYDAHTRYDGPETVTAFSLHVADPADVTVAVTDDGASLVVTVTVDR